MSLYFKLWGQNGSLWNYICHITAMCNFNKIYLKNKPILQLLECKKEQKYKAPICFYKYTKLSNLLKSS